MTGEGRYGERTVDLGPDDMVVLYTDGISEARNAEGEQFSETTMADVLASMRGRPAPVAARHLLEEAQRFSDDLAADDAAVLVLRASTR